MEFYTPSQTKRPVRLSEGTRQFAEDSLNCKYGLDTKKTMRVVLDDVSGYDSLSLVGKYCVAERKIVEEAPIRICDGEMLSGAATLGDAIGHLIPATYHGQYLCYSVSHITIAFYHVLEYGLDGYRERIMKNLPQQDDQGRELLLAMLETIKNIEFLHERYMTALREKAKTDDRYNYNLRYLERVPMQPPLDFREAVQSLWFTFAFMRLIGNWPAIGRIDVLLGDFLKKDLADGKITLDEARELLAHFMIKGCEWVCGTSNGSGDAQHYQNIVLSGEDADGNDITNEITYLILDIVEELPISDFPIAVRLSKKRPNEKLMRRMAEVIRHGSGVVAAYNNDGIIDELVDFGYDIREARGFANDGCWEVQVPGKTLFAYSPFDSLQIFQKNTLKLDADKPAHFDTFEDMYASFREGLFEAVRYIYKMRIGEYFDSEDFKKPGNRKQNEKACVAISLFEDDCIENGRSYYDGGTKYQTFSPHIGGAPDVADAMYAVKKLVFEEKKVSFDELMQILRDNWEGHEDLRAYVRNAYTYFGNDNDEVDELLARIIADFRAAVDEIDSKGSPLRFYAGISTFGRQIEWRKLRTASPHGFKIGEILASNIAPTPGTDKIGATGVIKSSCKLPLTKMTCGAALDIKLTPSSADGEDGIEAIVGLLRGFVNLGGSFLQIDVMDNAILLEAQKHPENYPTLAVRISGWSARFITLDKEWQQMIIERTAQNGV